MDIRSYPLGDQAILLEFGTEINPLIHEKVRLASALLDSSPPLWMIEYIPAFSTITVIYNASIVSYQEVCYELQLLLRQTKAIEQEESRTVEIPVCYGGTLGPDLEFVAKYNRLTPDEVVEIHTAGDYLVYMIGFAPGFPYIGGMSKKIAAPRRDTPRLRIPARSVGIAGQQTGIYPIETPGGWQIIGRTPLDLFLINKEIPSLLKSGDRIQFYPITFEEYVQMEKNNDNN